MFIVSLQKIGNSFYITVPAAIRRELQFKQRDHFTCVVTSKTSMAYEILNRATLSKHRRQLKKEKANAKKQR